MAADIVRVMEQMGFPERTAEALGSFFGGA
jgi:hypothetical protein